jgi:hypothetical protein
MPLRANSLPLLPKPATHGRFSLQSEIACRQSEGLSLFRKVKEKGRENKNEYLPLPALKNIIASLRYGVKGASLRFASCGPRFAAVLGLTPLTPSLRFADLKVVGWQGKARC